MSRSRRVLWRMAFVLLAAGTALAWLVSGRAASVEHTLRERLFAASASSGGSGVLDYLLEAIGERETAAWSVLEAMPAIAGMVSRESWGAIETAVSDRFGGDAGAVARYLLDYGARPSGPAKNLLSERAAEQPPPRYANRALAYLSLQDGLTLDAARYFAREGEVHSAAVEERRFAVLYFLRSDDLVSLRRLIQQPAFEDALDARALTRVAIADRDWSSAATLLWRGQWESAQPGTLLLVMVGATAWAVTIWQLLRPSGNPTRLLALCLFAFLLGAASTVPTMLLDAMFRAYFGFERNGDFLHDLGFYVASVGLREEFCKLIFVLPLAPWLIRRGSALEMLLAASFVGLGFAAMENAGYFEAASAAVGPGRFLTANFFHLAMTGLAGFYLLRAMARMGESYSEFFYVFGLVVVAHGLYNAFLALPELSEFSLFAYSVFIVLSQRYFVEVHSVSETEYSGLSASAAFVIGMCVFIGSTLVYLSAQSDFGTAFAATASGLVGVAVITVMFFREFREGLNA